MDPAADDWQLLEALIGRMASCSLKVPLAELLEADEGYLADLGIAQPTRRRILACAEVARRYQPHTSPPEKVTGPAQALAYLRPLRRLDRETLAVLLLDIRLHVIGLETIAVGAVAHVSVQAREVFGPAVASRAGSVVLAHNHPSGDAEPSPQDADFTRAMVDAGRILNIAILDHVIVTRRSYYSFLQHRRL